MGAPAKLCIYGENAATFLIFQAFTRDPEAIREVLLPNLKRFGDGRTAKTLKQFPDIELDDIEMWLFPCFGKQNGFGEPDVLLLAGPYAFWIEVETDIDCERQSGLRKALIQLGRFRRVQKAISAGPRVNNGALAIETLAGDGQSKRLKLRHHKVLQRARNRLAEAGRNGHDHYVLFTINKPKGDKTVYSQALRKRAETSTAGVICLPVDRCWYAYWQGDIRSKVTLPGPFWSHIDEEYIGKKTTPRKRNKSPIKVSRTRGGNHG